MRYIREREAREAACRENDEMRMRLEEYQTELENYREAMVSICFYFCLSTMW